MESIVFTSSQLCLHLHCLLRPVYLYLTSSIRRAIFFFFFRFLSEFKLNLLTVFAWDKGFRENSVCSYRCRNLPLNQARIVESWGSRLPYIGPQIELLLLITLIPSSYSKCCLEKLLYLDLLSKLLFIPLYIFFFVSAHETIPNQCWISLCISV